MQKNDHGDGVIDADDGHEGAPSKELVTAAAGGPAVRKLAGARKSNPGRSNGAGATGPRTATGKSRSRWNSTRHGILARVTPIAEGGAREKVLEFQHLLGQLRRDLAPATTLEEILIERIASSYWRLSRVLRAETAAIQAQIESARASNDAADVERRLELEDPDALIEPADRLHDVAGIDSVLEMVRAAASDVQDSGLLDAEQVEHFRRVVGRVPWALSAPEERLSKAAERERREAALADLEGMETELLGIRAEIVDAERRAAKRAPHRLGVPDAATADRLLRYESAIERQLYKAMHELERLQSLRMPNSASPRIRLQLES